MEGERRSIQPVPDAYDVRIGLADDELTAEQADLLGGVRVPGNATVNIFTTLVRHPGLFRKWLPLGGKLWAEAARPRPRADDPADRLAVRGGHEWAEHVPIARRAGVTPEEVEAIASGPDDPSWSPKDAALVRAVDQLHDDGVISTPPGPRSPPATTRSSSSRSRCWSALSTWSRSR